jgi:hypothetical protein
MHKWRIGIMAATAIAAGWAASVAPATAPGSRPATSPAASQASAMPDAAALAGWIAKLDADDYATREAATGQLAALPAEAVPAVKRALAARALAPEAAARAAAVLRVLEPKLAVAAMTEKNKERKIPVLFGSDPAAIPLDDTVITQIIPLQNLDPELLLKDLMPLLSLDAKAEVGSSLADIDALVITDTSAKINRLVQIIQKLDNAKRIAMDTAYRQLKFSKAADVARLVNEMFRPGNPPPDVARDVAPPPDGPGAPAPGTAPPAVAQDVAPITGGLDVRAPAAPGGRGGGAAARGKTLSTGRLHADYDSSSNTVIIEGPREQIMQALEMLDKIEAQAAGKQAAPAPAEPAPVKPDADANTPQKP